MNSNSRKNTTPGPPLGTINFIFAALGKIGSCPSKVMSVAQLSSEDGVSKPKRAKVLIQPIVGFLDEDKAGTIQPHDDAFGGYTQNRRI